jgi:hypothetical protein
MVAQKSEVFGGGREKRKLELFSISWLYWNKLPPETQSLINFKTYRNGCKKSKTKGEGTQPSPLSTFS